MSRFTPQRYCPDQHDFDAHKIAGRYYEKWPRSFLRFAAKEHYPRRMWVTLGAMFLIAKGRPRFVCKVADIAEAAGQGRSTTKTALNELEIDGWIERKYRKQHGSKYNLWTRYTICNLVPK